MRVLPQERKWWSPTLAATDSHGTPVAVPTDGWEASFDGGITWAVARNNNGRPGWLVAGANFPGPGDSAAGIPTDHVLTARVRPLIRLRDAPETSIDGSLQLHP